MHAVVARPHVFVASPHAVVSSLHAVVANPHNFVATLHANVATPHWDVFLSVGPYNYPWFVSIFLLYSFLKKENKVTEINVKFGVLSDPMFLLNHHFKFV